MYELAVIIATFQKKLQTIISLKYHMTVKILIVLLLFFTSLSSDAQNTVVKAGHFFDARSGKMLDNQVIIIHNGKIKQVGTNLKINITDSVIDFSNSYVLPGLMDCHVHITFNGAYRNLNIQEVYATESTAFRALRGAVVAKEFLDNGFTTIKDIGNDATFA